MSVYPKQVEKLIKGSSVSMTLRDILKRQNKPKIPPIEYPDHLNTCHFTESQMRQRYAIQLRHRVRYNY